MKIGAIIQARTSSTRLPRKVLKPLPFEGDINVLQHVIRRVSQSKLVNEIIVATTINKEDDEIVDIAMKENVKYYRGSLENVLERYYYAASENNLDLIVRVTSDSPFIDFNLIDNLIKSHINSNADYTSCSMLNIPLGVSAEIITFDSLKEAYENSTQKYEIEHVTPYIYKSHPENFKINKYHCSGVGVDGSDIRLTLDTPQDYTLSSLIYENLYNHNTFFNLEDILNLFDKKPYLKNINNEIVQKKICVSLEEELDEVLKFCENNELYKVKKLIKGDFCGK